MEPLPSRLSMSFVQLISRYTKPSRQLICSFSSATSLVNSNGTASSNTLVFNYLVETLALSEQEALRVSNRFPPSKNLENPESVVQFLKQLGFSDSHIQSAIRISPQILLSDINKTLKPKLQFFQDLGLTGLHLGMFIAKNSTVLTHSLEKKLIPCIDILKKILINDKNNQDLIRALRRCNWISYKNPESRLLRNIEFLKSCGIFGTQLSMLLTRQPHLFVMRNSALRDLVLRVSDLGFSFNSRMLVHALYTVSCLSPEAFSRKLELFTSFGFSDAETREMFIRAPALLRTSEEKLMVGLKFFLDDLKFERSVLVHWPTSLMYSTERTISRYGVLQLIKSKGLLKNENSFVAVLSMSEQKFLDKFIFRFKDNAEELLFVYKGHLLVDSGD
ncbi:hypothetical protein NMG60_11032955 [Bertholletia excelsa]